MSWLQEGPFQRRPIILIEDHLYHIEEILAVLAESHEDLLSLTTVVCLDRPGPDTAASVATWLKDHPSLQVVAAQPYDGPRFRRIPEDAFEGPSAFARLVASLLRPAGLLIQDVQLETLSFIPADRWWESIYLASTVRGTFAERPPTVRFLSNKRGYQATFGRDLLDAGFDPRDVLDKNQLANHLGPTMQSFLARRLSLRLQLRLPTDVGFAVGSESDIVTTRVGDDVPSQQEVEEALDLVLWVGRDGCDLGGRRLKGRNKKPRLSLRVGTAEADTWRLLLLDALRGRAGLPVISVGERVAPPDAGRAEATNAAARHIHQLRGRLDDGTAIRTAEHAYRLDARLRLGIAAKDMAHEHFGVRRS